jgi:hypothetical protein
MLRKACTFIAGANDIRSLNDYSTNAEEEAPSYW